ncbi:MAG: hypothetical protein AAFW74_10635, partial [Pseudomonadota bacterium]
MVLLVPVKTMLIQVSVPAAVQPISPGLAKRISSIQQQYMIVNGQPVLALRGRIANITGQDRRVPPLRFVLRNANGEQLHTWTLNSVGKGPIGAGVV